VKRATVLAAALLTAGVVAAGAFLTRPLLPQAASPSIAATVSPAAAPSPSGKPANPQLCTQLAIKVPDKLVDLSVAQESVCSTLSVTAHTPGINAVDLFSIRRPDKVLIATLEVARLRPDLDPRSSEVQGSIVEHVGDTSPQKLRVGDTFVWVSQARGLTLMTWFHRDKVLILAVRDIFDRPRTLLRQTLGIGA